MNAPAAMITSQEYPGIAKPAEQERTYPINRHEKPDCADGNDGGGKIVPKQEKLFAKPVQQALSTYGELTGMAMPLILLPSACLMAASVSLVPEISEACAVKQDQRKTREQRLFCDADAEGKSRP